MCKEAGYSSEHIALIELSFLGGQSEFKPRAACHVL